jgi:ParB/Sulfiredoxin domain
VPADTGFPRADVENDFLRARRRQVLARLAQRLRREPDDVNLVLPFDEVIAALGRAGERRLGLRTIPLDRVVGSVDSTRDFDRHFRPTSGRVRERWERLALAQRRGESIPPIDVYQVGDMYFVVDGHHRVSIAIATGQKTIDAYVTEIRTAVPAKGIQRRSDLLFKSYERLFMSRVKLPAAAYAKITVTDPWSYAELSETVEAWGFRLMQHEHKFCDRAEVSRRWYADEFVPVVRMLRAADLIGSNTDAEAYLTIARERYRLIRTHEWNDEIIEELQRQLGSPHRWRHRGDGVSPGDQSPDGSPGHRQAGPGAKLAPEPGCHPGQVWDVAAGPVPGPAVPTSPACAGALPPAGLGALAGVPESPRVRFRPVAGSNTCSARASTHSSEFCPSATREAGSSRATTVSLESPVSARPESRASSASSAVSTLPSSWVK